MMLFRPKAPTSGAARPLPPQRENSGFGRAATPLLHGERVDRSGPDTEGDVFVARHCTIWNDIRRALEVK
ncbi:MAG: hypothetical protein ABS75_02795 [Pelagibacterium sp. SCN 63-23]|nr:MAG: hypothetical protein ABS75_02795 [Pelagibacterium sp. SCN 63-23]